MRVLVVGGNIGGAVAAGDLAAAGHEVTIVERDLKRKKPCGGAVPPKAMTEFGIPQGIIERKTRQAVIIGPSGKTVSMPVQGSVPREDDYIVMVTREILDQTMRAKAGEAGADIREASFVSHEDLGADGVRVKLKYRDGREEFENYDYLVGADGAGSAVAKSCGRPARKHASAIQERLYLPDEQMEYYRETAELYLGDDISPDFYGWVFPKSDHVAVGTGCKPEHANRSYAFLEGVKQRAGSKLRGAKRILLEGHPLPMQRYKKLVYGNTVLVGDAGGMVAHTSGEGIYFAMASGRMAAQSIHMVASDHRRKLERYEKLWQKKYGKMFDFLEFLEKVSYTTNKRRELFVDLCDTKNVQRFTFDSYLFKQMVPVGPKDQAKMTLDTIARIYDVWSKPRTPIATAPPDITAKQALHLTRQAVNAGVDADEMAALAS
jgi:geranylgeranyl reductase